MSTAGQTHKIDRSHTFSNGRMCSVFIRGTHDKLEAHRVDWHGHTAPIPDDEKEAFWAEFEAFYGSVLDEAQKCISPAAMHSDGGLEIIFPDRVHTLKQQ